VNATGVTAGPAESNGKLLLGTWRDLLHVTCGLTACTPGSAPGPTLGNEYGKTLLYLTYVLIYLCLYMLLAKYEHLYFTRMIYPVAKQTKNNKLTNLTININSQHIQHE